ncbi:MAG: hypothetical protein WBB15_10935 [Ornithinimicrobium sp.]
MSTTEASDQMPANAMAFSQRLSGPRMRRPSRKHQMAIGIRAADASPSDRKTTPPSAAIHTFSALWGSIFCVVTTSGMHSEG